MKEERAQTVNDARKVAKKDQAGRAFTSLPSADHCRPEHVILSYKLTKEGHGVSQGRNDCAGTLRRVFDALQLLVPEVRLALLRFDSVA